MLVDSHCHLDFNDFEEDFEELVNRAKSAGVGAMLNAGNNVAELDKQLELSEHYPFIWTAVGVHPHNAEEYQDINKDELVKLSKHKKIVAIGECGLDYYYDYSPKEIQKKVFIEQIKAAQETDLPLIIHTRDADDDMIEILDFYYKKAPFRGVIHCFSSSQKLADFALQIGFYISASGIITFNKAQELRDVFKTIPLERLLVETDSPFLAPIPYRGRRNEPAFVANVAEKLAQIKDEEFDKIVQITSDNFFRLFNRANETRKVER